MNLRGVGAGRAGWTITHPFYIAAQNAYGLSKLPMPLTHNLQASFEKKSNFGNHGKRMHFTLIFGVGYTLNHH